MYLAVRVLLSERHLPYALLEASKALRLKKRPIVPTGRTDYGKAARTGSALLWRMLRATSAPLTIGFVVCTIGVPPLLWGGAHLDIKIYAQLLILHIVSICYLAVNLWAVLDQIIDERFRMATADEYKKIAPVDHRPVILFLRRFRDDYIEIDQGQQFLRRLLYLCGAGPLVWISWAISGPRRFSTRLFYLIADQLWGVAPILGIGEPGKAGPGGIVVDHLPAGENSVEQTDDSWRRYVTDHMNSSAWILLLVGSGPNVSWEFQELLAKGHDEKLAILFRPQDLDNVNMWYDLRESVKANVALPQLSSDQVMRALAVTRRPGGWTLLSTSSKQETQYRVVCSLIAAALHQSRSERAFREQSPEANTITPT